jgi:hypothetical protein
MIFYIITVYQIHKTTLKAFKWHFLLKEDDIHVMIKCFQKST